MHFSNLVSSAAALTIAATKVAAVTHGEETDFNGAAVKWQQIGKGMWTGIPVDEWDDEVNTSSDFDLGLDKIGLPSDDSMKHGTRSLELEARNLKSTCQAIAACATGYEDIQLAGVLAAVIESIDYAAAGVGTIWDVLNTKPLLTTVVGGTVATVAGIHLEKVIWPPPTEQCSTSNSEKDTLSSSVSGALSSNPTASSVSVTTTGPDFSYTVTMTATTSAEPPKPVVGQCFTAKR